MTRSEERIDAIEREIAYECACATSKKLTGKDEESERHVKRMGLLREVKDILLAEQKRSEGCAYCNSEAFKRVGVSNEPWDKPRVYLCGGNSYPPESEKFDYCPKCGKWLTEGESV